MSDCLFCKIIERKIPSKVVHEDEETFAFEDINPQAPVHVLVIPRRHVPSVSDLSPSDDALIGRLHRLAAKIAADRGVAQSGYRIVANTNRDAGQSVFHVHLHLLGGRPMQWPPG